MIDYRPMSRARVSDVLSALRGAFEKNGWHGPTVRGAVRGVTAREARRRPSRAHHSIHELVDHIGHWEAVVLRRHLRRETPSWRGRRDWTRPDRSFADSVGAMEEGHRALVSAVAALDDPDLDRRVKTSSGPRPLSEVLHGLAAHDAYHAGQIRLARTLLRAR